MRTASAANPSLVARCSKMDRISYEVLEIWPAARSCWRCAREYARDNDIPIHVRSSFTESEAWVSDGGLANGTSKLAQHRAVTYTTDEAKVIVRGVPDQPRIAARVFSALGRGPHRTWPPSSRTQRVRSQDVSCAVPAEDIAATDKALHEVTRNSAPANSTSTTASAKSASSAPASARNPGVAARHVPDPRRPGHLTST